MLAVSGEGVTILLIEQNAKLALEVSHRGYVMESGQIILEGEARSLLHDRKVRAVRIWTAVGALVAIHGLAPLDQPIERPDIAMVMHVGDHVRLSHRRIEHKPIVGVFIEQQIANGRSALHGRRPALRALLERRVCEQLSHRRRDLLPQLRLLQSLRIERTDIVGELACSRQGRLFHGILL